MSATHEVKERLEHNITLHLHWDGVPFIGEGTVGVGNTGDLANTPVKTTLSVFYFVMLLRYLRHLVLFVEPTQQTCSLRGTEFKYISS